jgi:hypothetical protein
MLCRPVRAATRILAIAGVSAVLAGCYFAFGFNTDPDDGFAPLEITQQPQSTTVVVGQSASFIVGVSGGGRITFQWQRNGLAIAGANGSAYTTPPATQADDGTLFTVRVCDDFVCLTSSPALLTVLRGT